MKADLELSSQTGCLAVTMYRFLRDVAHMHHTDTQEIEGINSIVKHCMKLAPSMHVDLLSARIQIKKEINEYATTSYGAHQPVAAATHEALVDAVVQQHDCRARVTPDRFQVVSLDDYPPPQTIASPKPIENAQFRHAWSACKGWIVAAEKNIDRKLMVDVRHGFVFRKGNDTCLGAWVLALLHGRVLWSLPGTLDGRNTISHIWNRQYRIPPTAPNHQSSCRTCHKHTV